MTLGLALLLQAASLLNWLDTIAQAQLSAREDAIRKIDTRAKAEARQAEVREKLLRLMGGLPGPPKGSLDPVVTATRQGEGFIIQNVHFQSFPGYHVTANLYLPATPGKHPAILHPMGHWEEGKAAAQLLASNLARKGFVVLVYDPVGQGERAQAYDARTGRSLAGSTTDQHFQDGARSILVGESFARYRIWDGIRALDYLESRPEVDANRIGCTGCSGGGTLTTYLSALDARIKVAAPACYMNSFRLIFPGPVGDSEQSMPGFLAEGLDLADWIELAAPKPYLIGSTKEDFFPIEGARLAYEEARRWYALFDAEARIRWAVGPGPHGTPIEIREAVYEWMIQHLAGGKGNAKEESIRLFPDHELWVTKSGQTQSELKTRDLAGIIAEQGAARRHAGSRDALLAELRQIATEPAPAFPLRTDLLSTKGPAKPQAILWVETQAKPSPRAKELAEQGYLVKVVWPRGTPRDAPLGDLAGDWITNTRAWLVGLNLPGLRAHDIRQAAQELSRTPGVQSIHAYATGVSGIWLLMAAALEPKISALWLDRTPPSLWSAINQPLHRDLHDAVIPAFATRWDLHDLRNAVSPRPVLWTDPSSWMRVVTHVSGDFLYRTSLQPDTPYLERWLQTPGR